MGDGSISDGYIIIHCFFCLNGKKILTDKRINNIIEIDINSKWIKNKNYVMDIQNDYFTSFVNLW
jgi:hypothetical protein